MVKLKRGVVRTATDGLRITLAKAMHKVKQSKTIKRQQTIPNSSAVGGDSKTNMDAVQAIEGQKSNRNGHTRTQAVRLRIMCS